MNDYDPLSDLADLVRTAFDYNTIDANTYAERLAHHLNLIEFEDDEDGRPLPLDAGETRAALAKALGIAAASGDSPGTRIARALVRHSISDYEVPDGRVIEIYESAIGEAVREGLAEEDGDSR